MSRAGRRRGRARARAVPVFRISPANLFNARRAPDGVAGAFDAIPTVAAVLFAAGLVGVMVYERSRARMAQADERADADGSAASGVDGSAAAAAAAPEAAAAREAGSGAPRRGGKGRGGGPGGGAGRGKSRGKGGKKASS